MKIIKTLGLICFFAISIYAQECGANIEGIVTNEKGEKLANAKVIIEGKDYEKTITTNKEGFFIVTLVPPGVFKTTASITVDGETKTSEPVEVRVFVFKTTQVKIQINDETQEEGNKVSEQEIIERY